MRRALAEDFASFHGVDVVMTLDDRLPDEPGPWRAVRIGPGGERSTLESLAAECDAVALIAPESCGILFERARLIEQTGARSLGSTPEAIARSGDKASLSAYWRELGVPTPDSLRVRTADGLPEGFAFPAVLKPIDGAGTVSTFFLESPWDLRPEMVEELPEGLLQPFVPGMPLSASFLFAPGHRHGFEPRLIGVGRQRVTRKDRRFSYEGGGVPFGTSIPLDPVRSAVESIPGLQGWVGVDFVWDSSTGAVTILEINPRLTTSYVGWRRHFPAGELARLWLAAFDETADSPLWRGPHDSRPRAGVVVDFEPDGSVTVREAGNTEDDRR